MSASEKRHLLIIDGNALIHRAWHALPPLATKTGLVVSGAYGFTMTLLGAIKKFRPEYVAVTFDLKGPTFRHKEYAAYKATREKKPDELYAQIPLVERILASMNVPVFTAEGFEADDVIGTIALLAKRQDPELVSVIVTGDKDTLQLVDSNTKVFTMRKGMTDTVLYDEAGVREKFGLDPAQMVDYKALRGDPSDNIPGVKGIGEKTATEILQKFGTLEDTYRELDSGGKKIGELKPSVREKLAASREDAFLAQRLCTIRRDVPLKFDLNKTAFAQPSREAMAPIFEEFQFNRLLASLPSESGASAAPPVPAPLPGLAAPEQGDVKPVPAVRATVEVCDAKTCAQVVSSLGSPRRIAFRTLAVKEDPIEPQVFAFAFTDGGTVHLIRGDAFASCLPEMRHLLADPKVGKVCHDLKREISILNAYGMNLHGELFDLMIASYLIHSGERRHGLEAILSFRRNVPPLSKEMTPEDLVRRLAELEVPNFLPLADEFAGELKDENLEKLNREMELPLAAVLARMERAGISIDADYFNNTAKEVAKRLEKVRAKITELAGGEFNVNSPKQMKEVLFDRLGLSPAGVKKTAKGGELSTAAAELEKLRGSHPIIGHILEYRELAKLSSTYLEVLPTLAHPDDGRIHASFNQTVTATGRLSSSEPNLQNIPTPETEYGKKVRNGFVAREGAVLLAADYSQIELRIAAHIADEEVMIGAFRKGEDIHWRTAAAMWGEDQAADRRRLAKAINFGILYGMGAQRLSESADISFMEAREYIERYFAMHQGIAHYIEGIHAKLRADGYVETLFGRRRHFRNFALMNRREQAEAERQAVNMPIQGTNADIIKLAMVRIDDQLRAKYGDGPDAPVKLVLQVHDELIFECDERLAPDVARLVKPIMENVIELKVPIVVDLSVGQRWGELEELEVVGD